MNKVMIFIFKCKCNYNLHLQRFSYLLLRLGVAKLCLTTILLIFVAGAFASATSDKVVKGKVVDNSGQPIPGASVVIDGTLTGVSTLNDGTFQLITHLEKGYLKITSVGFKMQVISFKINEELIVRMEDEISELDEVRVIAYGNQSKAENVGAISSIKADDIKDIPSPSLANLLQGKVPGMNVLNMSGAPGSAGTAVTIRGFNSLSNEHGRYLSDALWIVDNVKFQSNMSQETGLDRLAELDPNDIEDVQILKDASAAAIYGSEAANGVIIITTKKGRYNQQSKLSIGFSQTITMKPNFNDMMGGVREREHRLAALGIYQTTYYDAETNSYKYAESFYDAYKNGAHYGYFWNSGNGADIPILQDSLNSFYNNSTNLFDYYFNTARVTDVNLQLSGGAENIAYHVGLGYYDEKGVLRNTGFSRIKFNTNLSFKPFKGMESNVRMYLARTARDRSGKGKDRFNYTYDDYIETIPSELLTTSTLLPGPGHPAFDAMIKSYESTIEKNESYRFRGSFDLSYEFIKDLKLKSSIAIDYSQNNQHVFMPSALDSEGDTYSSGQIGRNLFWINENLLSYRKEFFDHTFDAVFGLSTQAQEYNSLSGYGRRAASDLIQYITWNGNVYDTEKMRVLKDFMSDRTKSTMASYFGRINYNYKKKYLASITLRRDGSSKFGDNNKWATFPSVGIGYAFSKESFMDFAKDVLDYGKFRLSWGKSGKNFESPYLAFGVLQQSSSTFLGNPTIEPEWIYGLFNRELTWEETSQYDVGLDLDFFDYRLSIVLDYYNRLTDKLLYTVSLPGNYSGYHFQWQNAYAIRNSGVEFEVKYKPIRNEKLTWEINFNMAHNWNRLEKSTDGRDLYNSALVNNLSIVGKSLNGIYALKNKGFYNSDSEVPYRYENGVKTPLGAYNRPYREGDRIIEDVDGNGRIRVSLPLDDDRVYCGSPLPTVSGGITNNIKWNGFDVSFLFNYVLGRHILNAGQGSSVGTYLSANPMDMVTPIFADLDKVTFWQKPGDKSDYPINRVEDGLQNFATNISSNVQKVNFIKLKTVSVGYSLPRRFLGFDARFFLSAENLFTITNYRGNDPETVDIVTGIDYYNNYPLARKITFGFNLNF